MSNLNIPTERINETGNYQTVATVRDIPDLTFEVESLDVSTEMEALALHLDPTTSDEGDEYDFNKAIPMDVISPFKTGQGLFSIYAGIVIPYLSLESVTYRYGLKANASQTFSFKGDSVFYVPGSPYYEQDVKNGNGIYPFAHTALPYVDSRGATNFALGVCWHNPATSLYKRLFKGPDYTETSGGITLTAAAHAAMPAGSIIAVTYGSDVADTRNQAVHQDTSIKPAAVKGKDIEVWIAYGATPVMELFTAVQSVEATRRVTLDPDGEFGNDQYVSQDYDIPAVSGNVVVRPRDVEDLFSKIALITNRGANEIAGPLSSQPVELEVRIFDPNATTPTVVKTLYTPDARFTPGATQARVGQKLEPTLPWESDSGVLLVYDGERP